MPLSLDKIEALAPDQSSLDAARKLIKSSSWPTLAKDDTSLVWGECQGSGATPYRVVISEADGGYKCTCPSRKFPCKHSLALMWMRAEAKVAFSPSPVPPWVTDWLSRRRGPSNVVENVTPPAKSIRQTSEPEVIDAKAEARALAARERNAQEREASLLAGLDELDLWLEDQVDSGLAGFVTEAGSRCRLMAQRLVDAKAPGLATRLDAFPSRLYTLPEPQRPLAVVEELGLFHLMAQAYRRQQLLSPELRADIRLVVGWTLTREALLGDAAALRQKGNWLVFAVRNEVQPDKLRRTETWLMDDAPEPHLAVLIDFVPVSVGTVSSGYAIGDHFEAELVYYPSPLPLRALVAQQQGPTMSDPKPLSTTEVDLSEAYSAYERALALRPWLGDWPILFGTARLRRQGSTLFLCSVAQPSWGGLPLHPSQNDLASPLLSLETFSGAGIVDGKTVWLAWAETSLGRWVCS